jgi:3-hydroxyisobutyrate dehydrogenase-like beta-hydroxyacid dehydrogenase
MPSQKPLVAIVAPGNMGAAIGGRLIENGLEVRTSLAGRSQASAERARKAGLTDCDDAALADADIFLSIVPPSEVMTLAERMAPVLTGAGRKPVFVEANAISPETAKHVAHMIEPTGAAFVDGGIIGGPPREGYSPTLYLSGPDAPRAAVLGDYGIRVGVMDGPVGAASALKMCYAGINKGIVAIGSAMILAAGRAGAADALLEEMAHSQPEMLARLGKLIPTMFSKAYRWAPEMEEIANFADEDLATAQVYRGFAELYARLAENPSTDAGEIKTLAAFAEAAKCKIESSQ